MRYFLTIAALALIASDAIACSCPSQSREEAIAKADAVFSGIVESVDIVNRKFMPVEATVRVTHVTKGNAEEHEKVAVIANATEVCGERFEVGKEVEVAVHEREGIRVTGYCYNRGLRD